MAILVRDSFNRADNNVWLIATDTGQPYEVYAGVGGTLSNQVYVVSPATEYLAVVQSNVADVSIQLKIPVQVAYNSIIFRSTDASNYMYFAREADNTYKVVRNQANVYTTILSTGITPANGDVIKVIVSGSLILCYVNGTFVGSVTETFNQTATKHGFYTAGTTGRLDDFLIENAPAVYDSFTRTNSTTSLGSADTGQSWTQLLGTWGINSNTAYQSSSVSDAMSIVDSGYSNGEVVAKFSAYGDNSLYFRVTNATNWWRFTYEAGSIYLQKCSAGSVTTISSTTYTAVNGDIAKVALSGPSVSCFINNVPKLSTVDAFLQTNTKHGIGNSYTEPNGRFDDFAFYTFANNYLVYDSFSRVSTTSLGNADTGQPWIFLAGTSLGTIGNQAYSPTGTEANAAINSGYSDVSISLTLAVKSLYQSIFFRVKDTANFLQLAYESSNTYKLTKKVAGANTTLGDSGVTPQSGDVINVVCVGSNISCYVNGTLALNVIDAFNQTETKHGFDIGSTSAGRVDNFTVAMPDFLVYDSFNRADSDTTIGNAESGQPWQIINGGALGIYSGFVYIVSDNDGVAVIDSGTINADIQLRMILNTAFSGIIFRAYDFSTFFRFSTDATMSSYQLWSSVSGSLTQLLNLSVTPTDGDILRVKAAGSSLTFYVNGSQVGTYTDSSIAGTKHGMYLSSGSQVDDFMVSRVSAPSSISIAGSTSSTGTVIGSVTEARQIISSASAVSTATGDVKTSSTIASSTNATSTSAGAILISTQLTSSGISAVGSIVGDLVSSLLIGSSVSAISALTGDARSAQSIVSSADAVSTVTGDMKSLESISASVSAVTTASATISVAGSIALTSTVKSNTTSVTTIRAVKSISSVSKSNTTQTALLRNLIALISTTKSNSSQSAYIIFLGGVPIPIGSTVRSRTRVTRSQLLGGYISETNISYVTCSINKSVTISAEIDKIEQIVVSISKTIEFVIPMVR